MGRFKALICGASNLRRYQKIESNEENTTKDYYCYKCAECGHRGKAKVRTIFLFIRKNYSSITEMSIGTFLIN